MARLGKVTHDLDVPRGPDAVFAISVPAAWLGRTIEVTLPKKAHCAACEGGGCDLCGRAGAVSLPLGPDGSRLLEVGLPAPDSLDRTSNAPLLIRIPEAGGAASEPTLPPGHLLLKVRVEEGQALAPFATSSLATASPPGPSSAPVVRLADDGADRLAERRTLMKRSLVMAVFLVGLFIVMLKLSGWL